MADQEVSGKRNKIENESNNRIWNESEVTQCWKEYFKDIHVEKGTIGINAVKVVSKNKRQR